MSCVTRLAALAVTAGVLAALLTGCAAGKEAPVPSRMETSSQSVPPSSGQQESKPSHFQPTEPVWTQYHHRGLHFTLLPEYSAMELDSNRFSFDNGSVFGTVTCYPMTYFQSLSAAATSKEYAEFLLSNLSQFYAEAQLCSLDGTFHYVIFQREEQTLVRGLYVYRDVGWLVELSCDSRDMLGEMTRIITGCWVEHEQLPNWSAGTKTNVEHMGLRLTVPGYVLEQASEGKKRRFLTSTCQGSITTDGTGLLPENVNTAEEILRWYCTENGEEPSEITTTSGGSFAVMELARVSVHCRIAVWRGTYRYWILQISGTNADVLNEALQTAVTDDLDYERTVTYDLNQYSHMDDLLEALQEDGQAGWGRYTLRLTGLQSDITLKMNGCTIESIRVFNHVVTLSPEEQIGFAYDGPNGEFFAMAKDQGDSVVFTTGKAWYGFTWVFSRDNLTRLYPKDGMSTVLYQTTEGELRCRRTALRYCTEALNQEIYLPLHMAISPDEVCWVEEPVSVRDGKVFRKPGKTYTVEDIYGLQELYAYALEEGVEDATLEELLWKNRSSYPLKSDRN